MTVSPALSVIDAVVSEWPILLTHGELVQIPTRGHGLAHGVDTGNECLIVWRGGVSEIEVCRSSTTRIEVEALRIAARIRDLINDDMTTLRVRESTRDRLACIELEAISGFGIVTDAADALRIRQIPA